jgi:molybdopterin converting factor small subunit
VHYTSAVAIVKLRSPLRELAGGRSEIEVLGGTVGEIVGRLEHDHPKLAGWVLDERGVLREHVNVFVNGDRQPLEATVSEQDRIHILAAISGGSDEMAELLVGTRKGLFVLRGRRGGPFEVIKRKFRGQAVEYAIRDPRTGTYCASVTHGQYGPHLFHAKDPTGDWEQADGPAFPDDADATVKRIWVIQPGEEDGVVYAGVDPAALFKSEDGGRTWSLNRPLWDDPSRKKWQPGAGGMCLHSIATWPGDPKRLALGISAAGVWLTDDGGESWRLGTQGLVARYLPEDSRTPIDLCVHNVHRSPEPETLYLQFHGGVYRSDDAGESWIDIGSEGGLPSDFGFPMVTDPHDASRAYVIPLNSDGDRVTPEGKARVFETRDRGETWQPLTDGLPQEDAYLTVLRQAFCHDGSDPLGLYFGATSGELFGSADGGQTWKTVAARLAPVLSVRASA